MKFWLKIFLIFIFFAPQVFAIDWNLKNEGVEIQVPQGGNPEDALNNNTTKETTIDAKTGKIKELNNLEQSKKYEKENEENYKKIKNQQNQITQTDIQNSLKSGLSKIDAHQKLLEYCAQKQKEYEKLKNEGKIGLIGYYDPVCDLDGKEYENFMETVNTAISTIFRLAILLAVLAGVWAGIKYFWASYNGEEKLVEENRAMLKNILIGLILIILSWYIVDWIVSFFSSGKYSGLK